jgi:hypothetical protein
MGGINIKRSGVAGGSTNHLPTLVALTMISNVKGIVEIIW